jgi:metallophosphoesterase superfamily enzyme
MATEKLTDNEFLELWNTYKSATLVAKMAGISERRVHRRRRALEQKLQTTLDAKSPSSRPATGASAIQKARIQLGIENGVVLVFSDAHFWPGYRSTAFNGLLWAIRELKPKAVIANGDCFDGASISRHPSIMWSHTPSVIEELKACEAAMGEIEEEAKKARYNVKLIWTLGNHDARFESRLAANAPQYEQVKGFSLKDHFPAWQPCWSCWPTDDVVVKHRWKGGIHATHGNTSMSGKTMVTGHLHSLKVTPYTDYNGSRYGVDTGCLAEVDGPQFMDYLEDAPVNWRSGFAVLTFKDGKLLWPELVHKWAENQVEFRGQIIDV